MTTEVYTPYDHTSAAVDLSRKTFRKQILPMGSINYGGRTIHFNREYLENVVNSFKKGAFDQVPFQLADSENRHTNDPERTRGYVRDLHLTDSGLDAEIDLTDRGAEVVKENPNLGVSVRLYEDFAREGNQYGRALQHVLGTLDPYIQNMSPWRTVEASTPGADETLDLTRFSYTSEDAMSNESTDTEGVTLSQEMYDKLVRLLGENEGSDGQGDQDSAAAESSEGSDSVLTDEEEADFDAAIKSIVEEDEKESEPVAASYDDTHLQNQIVELNRKLEAEREARRTSQVDQKLAELKDAGVAPAIIDAARPLLKTEQVLELSGGEKLDVSGQADTLVKTLVDLARNGEGFLSLDAEEGRYVGSNAEEQEREELLANWPEN